MSAYVDEIRAMRALSPPLPWWAWLRRRRYNRRIRPGYLARFAATAWNGITWGEWTDTPTGHRLTYTPADCPGPPRPPAHLTADERAILARPASYGVNPGPLRPKPLPRPRPVVGWELNPDSGNHSAVYRDPTATPAARIAARARARDDDALARIIAEEAIAEAAARLPPRRRRRWYHRDGWV